MPRMSASRRSRTSSRQAAAAERAHAGLLADYCLNMSPRAGSAAAPSRADRTYGRLAAKFLRALSRENAHHEPVLTLDGLCSKIAGPVF